jgi:hypothetical protein
MVASHATEHGRLPGDKLAEVKGTDGKRPVGVGEA